MKPEQTLRSDLVYTGKRIKIYRDRVQLENGAEAERDVIRHPEAVTIIPFLDSETIIMVRQFRYIVGEELLELPAGVIEANEHPDDCARRELEEETGYIARDVRKLTEFFTTPGVLDERMHLYVATELDSSKQRLDADEVIEVERIALRDALDLARTGKIKDAKTLTGLLFAAELAHR